MDGKLEVPEVPAWRFFAVTLIVNVPSKAVGVHVNVEDRAKPRRSCIGPPGGATLKLYT